jgi:putative FmdB family regulatory protein
MPTYEYRCDDCNHTCEERQSITADPLVICPKCQKDTLRRLISRGGGIIFKGSGFYCTDYKNVKPPKNLDDKSI